MLRAIWAGMTCTLLAAGLPAADVLHYQGSFADEEGVVLKKFDVRWLLDRDEAAAVWWLEETGTGNWGWADRFGQVPMNSASASATGPALRVEHEEVPHAISLVPAWLDRDSAWQAGQAWTSDKLRYEVSGREKKAGRSVWRVTVSSPYGRKRTLWIGDDNIVLAVAETVFLGQGLRHTLKFELVERQPLSADLFQTARSDLQALIELRTELEWSPREVAHRWTDEQLKILDGRLPEVTKQVRWQPARQLVKAAQQDAKAQTGDAQSAESLAKRAMGRKVGTKFQDAQGAEVTLESQLGRVTILHFWDYRDKPLQPPYGQVGYLDFLYRRHKEKEARVIGVVVNSELSDMGKRAAVVRSARKLSSFMNLSYPLVFDHGTAIAAFGDPRSAGLELPLYILLDSDGKVIHYRAGLHDVQRNRGLQQLDQLVTQALETDE